MPRPGHPIIIGPYAFPSLSAAAQAFGRSETNIAYHKRKGTLDSLLVFDKNSDGFDHPIEIRGTVYPSMQIAADTLGVSISAVSHANKRGTLDTLGTRNLFK